MGSTRMASALAMTQHQVAEAVDLDREALFDHGRGAVLFDDRRTAAAEAGRQVVSLVDGEAAAFATGPAASGGGGQLQPRPLDQPHAGDLPVHELDDFAG